MESVDQEKIIEGYDYLERGNDSSVFFNAKLLSVIKLYSRFMGKDGMREIEYYVRLTNMASKLGSFLTGSQIYTNENGILNYKYSFRVNHIDRSGLTIRTTPDVTYTTPYAQSQYIPGPRAYELRNGLYYDTEFLAHIELLRLYASDFSEDEFRRLQEFRSFKDSETVITDLLDAAGRSLSTTLGQVGIHISPDNCKVRMKREGEIEFIITDLCSFIGNLFGRVRDYEY